MSWLQPPPPSGTRLAPGQVLGVVIEIVDVGAEGLEVRDDKLLPEGLGEQHDVALDTPERGNRKSRDTWRLPTCWLRVVIYHMAMASYFNRARLGLSLHQSD